VNAFLAAKQKSGGVYYCSLDMPKSFVLAGGTVFVSNVSAGVIRDRVGRGL
jgi:hypothetical protein